MRGWSIIFWYKCIMSELSNGGGTGLDRGEFCGTFLAATVFLVDGVLHVRNLLDCTKNMLPMISSVTSHTADF